MEENIRSRFDEILSHHFHRLIGTNQGIGGIPLNLATIGCLVLLGGREIEIENSPSDTLERYTHEHLINEAADLGIEPDDFLHNALQDFVQRGYAEIDSEGRFLSRQNTITMARMLNRIFPKMQGINLLAYAGQTIAEVTTGRTDIESAISRFDQTLNHHGVPFAKQKSSNTSSSTDADATQISQSGNQQNRVNREQLLAELYSRDRDSRQSTVSSSPRHGLKVLSGGGVLKHINVDHILPKDETIPGTNVKREIKEKEEPVEVAKGIENSFLPNANDLDADQEIQANAPTEESDAVVVEESIAATEPEQQTALSEPSVEAEEVESILENEEDFQPTDERGAEKITSIDDIIADKIAAFEKDLSLTCPICRANVLKEQSTAAGKVYYTCPSESCNFISWGKPHHVECQRCKNPFLIEVTDTSGESILKCPRATCQHRQSLTPKRVKVVRKRLVRRRK